MGSKEKGKVCVSSPSQAPSALRKAASRRICSHFVQQPGLDHPRMEGAPGSKKSEPPMVGDTQAKVAGTHGLDVEEYSPSPSGSWSMA